MSLRAFECVLKPVASTVQLFCLLTSAVFIFWSGPRADSQTSGPTAASLRAWNDNSLINIQKEGGDPARQGNVKLEFYGHDAFQITSPAGLTILTDPWRNDATGAYPKWFLKEFPALRVDIILSTHAHFDHNAVDRPLGLMVMERLVGRFELGDVEIIGLADKHQCESAPGQKSGPVCPPNNAMDLDNAIQVIATGGLRIAVWGDNRAVPDPSLDRYLKNIDVLILPVDTVLTRPEVEAILRKYDPKAIIPAHYFVEGLTTPASGVEPADSWVSDQENHHADVRRLKEPYITLTPSELKGSHHRIYYFGNHFEEE